MARFCEQCGEKLEASENFCPFCGAEVIRDESPPQPSPPSPPTSSANRDGKDSDKFVKWGVGALVALAVLGLIDVKLGGIELGTKKESLEKKFGAGRPQI